MGALSIIIDVVIVLVFVVAVINGYRRGFVKMMLSIVAVLLSLFIAGTFAAPLAAWSNEKFVADKVSESVDSYIEELIEENNASSGVLSQEKFDSAKERINGALPEKLNLLLKNYDISVDEIFEKVSPTDNLKEIGEKIKLKIQESVILPVLKVISFIVLYIVSSFVLNMIVGFIGLVAKLRVLEKVNKALGAVLGAVRGLSVITVFCPFLVLAAKFLPDNALSEAISAAYLTNLINDTVIKIIY